MDQQIKGGFHDSVHFRDFSSLENSHLFYVKMREVFLDINRWDHLFKKSTEFYMKNAAGKEKSTPVVIGDLVTIKIPGPRNRIGFGYDWVQIASVEMHEARGISSVCISLQPAKNPLNPNSESVAHFYRDTAKNYFIIKKEGTRITAEVHGRNEIPNYSNLPVTDKLRNFFIAHGGIFGMSKIQWEVWSKNMLDEKHLRKCLEDRKNH